MNSDASRSVTFIEVRASSAMKLTRKASPFTIWTSMSFRIRSTMSSMIPVLRFSA